MAEDDRAAFMEAIVKLAFRESFLRHYQHWLYPPFLITDDAEVRRVEMKPGSLIPMSDADFAKVRAGKLVFQPE
jgi:hypothetical protein